MSCYLCTLFSNWPFYYLWLLVCKCWISVNWKSHWNSITEWNKNTVELWLTKIKGVRPFRIPFFGKLSFLDIFFIIKGKLISNNTKYVDLWLEVYCDIIKLQCFFEKLGYLAKRFEVKTSQLSFEAVLGTIHRRVQMASVHFFGLPSQKMGFFDCKDFMVNPDIDWPKFGYSKFYCIKYWFLIDLILTCDYFQAHWLWLFHSRDPHVSVPIS